MKAKDALIRSFPARALFLPKEIMETKVFVEELGPAIHKLSIEQLKQSMETITKGGNVVAEARQSPSPRLVSEWLFGAVLSSYGSATPLVSFPKRTHDDVVWKDTDKPWRRSGVWLSVRVTLQLALRNSILDDEDSCYYKNFILFLLAYLSTKIMSTDSSPTTLHILRVKLARRNAKLGDLTFPFVQMQVQRTLGAINAAMGAQRHEVIQRDEVTIPSVPTNKVHDRLTIRNSRDHLHMVWDRSQRPFTYPLSQYSPPKSIRIRLSPSHLPSPDVFAKGGDPLTSLGIFEHWVEKNLQAWLNVDVSRPFACRDLNNIMHAYYRLAASKYNRHPERMSYMLLTIFELWVAVDVIAGKLHPLLLEYSPEVPDNIFETLLLDKKAALERLARIELHVKSRQQKRNVIFPSIFSSPSAKCFAVNFYDQSNQMQTLRTRIEDDAQQVRDAKSAEWSKKKLNFENLMKKVNRMECGEFIPRGIDRNGLPYVGRPRHDRKCKKCALEKQANEIQIEKHEWPLPKSEILCKAVVFELQTPEALISWRDSTWFVVHHLGRVDINGRECKQNLLLYPPLVKYVQRKNRHITLGSWVKPMIKAHYFKGGLDIDEIFVQNDLLPRLKDTTRSLVWTAEQASDAISLRRYCQSQLPGAAPKHLVQQVNGTGHTHNSVLALHSKCPPEMSPHEHVLFGSLRSGEKLQFVNILAMIMSSEADINATTIAVLVSHAVSQVGKRDAQHPSSCLRDSQLDILNESFCRSLLSAVEARFSTIEANWKEATAAGVLLVIATRVLSLCPHAELEQVCLAMIFRIRQAALKWIRQLAELHGKERNAPAESGSMEEISRQIVNSSMLVRRTFDLDPHHQQSEFTQSGAVADYIEASIHLHDHKEQAFLRDTKQQAELLSDSCSARRCEPYLLLTLADGGKRISHGIKRFWETASFTDSWQTVHDNDTSWIQNCTASKTVHYNLVTGSLLVSGRSLSRLPPGYTDDPLYRSIFADLDLDVFASDEDDMEYMSRVLFQDHRIYFGKRGKALLIRSRCGADTFEAILRDVFAGDLPESIFRTSLPWMSLRDGKVFFRRHDRAWSSHSDDWALSLDIASRTIISMNSKIGYLIDNCSDVGRTICRIFQPFEQPDHIVVFKSNDEITSVQIKLPRYHLNFFVQHNGDVKCKELSAVVDRSQFIGTLHGLKNMLVLRAVNNVSPTSVRTVLIPNGDVTVSPESPHVKVYVQIGNDENLFFSQYRLDGRLGQLVSDDLEGHLFKTYLHAITSFPAPDTFTSRTGTEEAFLGLSDPVTRTSIPLSARAQKLLNSLAALSPSRKFYPEHLQTMHTDTFNEVLPVLSQRDIFFGTVKSIISHNCKASFLFEGSSVELPRYRGDIHLLDRSHRHSSKLFANESVAGIESATEDVQYNSRDLEESLAQRDAFSIASLVTTGQTRFSVDPWIKELVQGWQTISGFKQEFSVLSFSRLLNKPLKEQWASLLSLCRTSPPKFSLAFILSLMAYGNPGVGPYLRTLLAFSVSSRLQALPSPENDFYELREGHVLSQKEITAILSKCEIRFVSDSKSSHSDSDNSEDRIRFDTETADQCRRILDAVKSSWPGSEVRLPRKSSLSHYKYDELKTLLNGRFAAWFHNYKFLSLCSNYEQELHALDYPSTAPILPSIVLPPRLLQRDSPCSIQPSLLNIMRSVDVTEGDFSESCPSMLDRNLGDILTPANQKNFLDANDTRAAWEELEDIVEELEGDAAPTVQEYGKFLENSLGAHRAISGFKETIAPPSLGFLQQQATIVQNRIDYILDRSRNLLSPRLPSDDGLVEARLWPSVSDMALLQLLSAEHRAQLPPSWKKVILCFAEEITALQRVERMQKYLAANDNFALSKELANPAHAGWSTEQHPDWLLIEIQNQILIRPVQIMIADEIIKPESGVVLADMGIGKSSTILPMVVTALATGSSLVRVIVLKPLANEMLRILSRSLSGLVGRAVYFLPISRQTTLAGTNPQKLREIYESCRQNAGVLVSLPEHLNSFRLLCNDKLNTDPDLAQELFGIQKFLDGNARDVMDESDQLLEPGYELVYTTGESLLLSKSPERWIVSLEMLDLVQRYARQALEKAPFGLEVERRAADAFDHIRILSDAGSTALVASLVDAVIQSKLPSVPLGHCNPEVLHALRSFLQDVDVDPEALELIFEHFEGSDQLDILYVVRGLISCQILTHALRKRWLVNYGLDRSRPGGCLAAVPYRAKAVPSQSAEFAQPETMIILTTLSYYYTGLQYRDLRQCILMLLRSRDPSEEFSRWVKNSKLPPTYRKASSINLEDASCVDLLYQHLRLNKAVIDYFLKLKVFPKEAREFTWKLSTSAWDLCANDSGKITTGFSGTCDSRIPSTVKQKDLQHLRHSTASTLATVLRYDNRRYICARSSRGLRLTTDELLDLIVSEDKERSVIIDVGAQFLEDNKEIASKWLSKCKNKMAAIFFSDNDEKMVVNRDGTIEKFNSSIFKDEIGSCLIYLDEFHTRGTDFQLPDAFAAAVLLGPRIPKDNLVQACMRMRKLAVSQSVVFIAPPEVDQSIRAVTKTPLEDLSSIHVVRWAIKQSCVTLKHQNSLRTTKGILHSRRRLAAARHILDSGHVVNSKTYLNKIRERESRPISEMYRSNGSNQKELPFEPSHMERDDEIMANLLVEWDRTDIADFKSSGISEEQEREVLHEVEEEREIQRPNEVIPAIPKECKALLNLITDGILPTGSADGIYPAFEVLNKTSLAQQYSQASWPMQILVTADFIDTIVTQGDGAQDDFLRPVQWVLHAKRIKQPIIISPHEAEKFLPFIRQSKHASLFLYQAKVRKDMAPFAEPNIYKIPERSNGATITQEQVAILNLFAGQLYFHTFEEYQLLCTLIGLWDGERELPFRRRVANDNWVAPACRKANGWNECIFSESPVQALKEFIKMRRLGDDWSYTHMGIILGGRILHRANFEEEEDVPVAEMESLSMTEVDGHA